MSVRAWYTRRSNADVTANFGSKYKLPLAEPAAVFTTQIFVLLYQSDLETAQAMHFACFQRPGNSGASVWTYCEDLVEC